MTFTNLYPSPAHPPTTQADADRLWVADLRAAAPADLRVLLGVPHAWTDGVLVYDQVRYDALSRARAALWLARGPDPALQVILVMAQAHGPDMSLDRPRFPTETIRLLELSAHVRPGRPIKDERTGYWLWCPQVEAPPAGEPAVRDFDRR